MTDKLPPQLLQLFAPRPALRYLPPADHPPEDRKTNKITGLGQFLDQIKDFDDGYVPTESWLQRKDRERLEKQEKAQWTVTDGYKTEYKPKEDPNIVGDPLKTLFIARLSYNADEKDLEREFGRYGPIERIRLIEDDKSRKKGRKHKGYGFVVFERDSDMKAAYKDADGLRIKDRRITVDVERGRTVKEWRPRRYGGGLGGRHYTKAAPPRAAASGYGPPSGPGGFRGGGFGGGFRGGFRGGRGGGGFGGDRGGYGGGRGGYGGDRGGYGGGRGGIGYSNGAPEGAPSGPRGGGRSGFGGDRGGYANGNSNGGGGGGGGRSYGGPPDAGTNGYGGGSRYGDRPPRDFGGGRGDRDAGSGGYRDRDREFDRKRPHDGGGYEDSRKQRRY